jgi:WD40 repeat protein
VSFTKDSRWAITETMNRGRIWDLSSDDPAASSIPIPGRGGTNHSIINSSDGRWLATVVNIHEAQIRDLSEQNPRTSRLTLDDGEIVWPLTISDDGRWLVAAGRDHTVRLWDLTADDPTTSYRILRGHTDVIFSVGVTPDGRWLVTAGADETARLWDLSVDSLLERAETLVGRQFTEQEKIRYRLKESL